MVPKDENPSPGPGLFRRTGEEDANDSFVQFAPVHFLFQKFSFRRSSVRQAEYSL